MRNAEIKYKKLILESGKGKNIKIKKTFSLITFIIAIFADFLTIYNIVRNKYDDHFIFVVMMIISFLAIMCFIYFKYLYLIEKRSRKITLYLYDIEEFMILNNVPYDKNIVFIDTNGCVLCKDYDIDLFKDWESLNIDNHTTYYDFCKLCDSENSEYVREAVRLF